MMHGQKVAGHPVVVSNGAVFTTACDFRVLGKVDLAWKRFYITSIASEPGPLGFGWTTPFFCSLLLDERGYRFRDDEGGETLFEDPQRIIDSGGTVTALGAFAELSRHNGRLVVTRWKWNSCRIRRFIFNSDRRGIHFTLARIDDDEGQALDILRDAANRIGGVRQKQEGRTVVLDYDTANRISAIWLHAPGSNQQLATYSYDGGGRLTSATDALGYAVRYEYDELGRLSKEELKDGSIYVFRYDSRGRCVYTSGQDRYNEKTLHYHDVLNWTEVTDSCNACTRYQWLPSGQVTTEIDPGGAVKRTDYDEHGRIVALIDGLNTVTRYHYDDRGNCDSVVEPTGKTTTVEYNNDHQPVIMTDSVGRIWRRQYDEDGRCTLFTDALGRTWAYEYDQAGNLACVTDAAGSNRRFSYDQNGTQFEVTDWAGNLTCFTLDQMGRTIRRVDALGNIIYFQWDALGHLIGVDYPNGSKLRCEYDAGGNLTRCRDRRGNITQFRYNTSGRMTERTDQLGQTLRFLWGSEPGRLDQVVNQNGEIHRFVYDITGRMIEERTFDGRHLFYMYDPSGRCTEFTNGSGQRISYTYDPAGRMAEKLYDDGSKTSYEYDIDGNLISGTRGTSTVSFDRDLSGRLVKETQDHGLVEYEYDSVGNVARLRTSRGYDVRYEFDPRGYVTSLMTAEGHRMTFSYDATGNETGRLLPGGLRLAQSFSPAGQLTKQALFRPSAGMHTAMLERSFEYDRSDNLVAQADGLWGRTNYAYDAVGRLVSVTGVGRIEEFEYDPAGNITAVVEGLEIKQFAYLSGNRVRACGNTTYAYDENSRIISKFHTESDGRVSSWAYEWNADDELVALRTPDGGIWRYEYDAFGRRTAKHGPNGSTLFVWEGTRVIQELFENSVRSSWLFYSRRFTPAAKLENGRVYSILTDHIGTPREMVDREGRIVWAAKYRAWGTIDRLAAKEVDCPLRFPGQWCDEESGLYYSWFRYYDPEHGHFLAADPIGLNGGFNELLYAGDPVNWIDPWGLNACGDEEEEEPVEIVIDKKKYPEAAQHIEDNDPVIGRIDREGSADRRAAAMKDFPPVAGKDRDEVPPAILDTGGAGSSVRPIDPSDNRGAGASMGNQMRGLDDKTLVRIVAR